MSVNPVNPSNTREIWLSEGGSLQVKDYRGFVIFEIKENGDFKHKGRQVKI